ncbi:MAG: hypothetical protein HQL39_03950, partial [Alphaproteobacteria bacterium]|nr:hypothetical protein [Alphaproteobacteria bacterium]
MSVLPVDQQPGMTERLTLTANGPAGLSGVEPSSGEQGSFLDFIDIINPLQHIPVVNTIYRELTGDAIKPIPALVGGTLFGGPIGFAAAMANMAVEDQTGKTVDQHLVSL